MDYKDILTHLAPCGLDCSKCLAFSEGEIKALSMRLKHLLGDFDGYADRFSKFLPIFSNYPGFKILLSFLAQGDCLGCRRGNCRYPNCGVAQCQKIKTKELDFCFQCREFPCEKSNFDSDLKQRWIQMNRRMKEIGVEAYFDETKDLPRYR